MVMWTILTWILVLTFIHFYGFIGVPIAFVTVSATLVVVVYLVKRFVQFSFWSSIITPLLASLVQIGWYVCVLHFIPQTLVWLVPAAGVGVILYGGVVWMGEKGRIMDIIRAFRA
jgi:O-antigen/teichoic acid export membrane protein